MSMHDSECEGSTEDCCCAYRKEIAALTHDVLTATEERDQKDKEINALVNRILDLSLEKDAMMQGRDEAYAQQSKMCHLTADQTRQLAASQAREAKIREIVAKMRADLKSVGGFENLFSGQPAVNIREYILDLEDALALPAKDSTLHEQLAASQARIELLERDDKSGDYETLYAQTVVELERSQAREAKLREALEHYRNMALPRS